MIINTYVAFIQKKVKNEKQQHNIMNVYLI